MCVCVCVMYCDRLQAVLNLFNEQIQRAVQNGIANALHVSQPIPDTHKTYTYADRHAAQATQEQR